MVFIFLGLVGSVHSGTGPDIEALIQAAGITYISYTGLHGNKQKTKQNIISIPPEFDTEIQVLHEEITSSQCVQILTFLPPQFIPEEKRKGSGNLSMVFSGSLPFLSKSVHQS